MMIFVTCVMRTMNVTMNATMNAHNECTMTLPWPSEGPCRSGREGGWNLMMAALKALNSRMVKCAVGMSGGQTLGGHRRGRRGGALCVIATDARSTFARLCCLIR